MFLQSFMPNLPTSIAEIIIYVVACLGAILITYGIFLELERRQDLVFAIGSACLFVYALFIGNLIFTIAMAGFFLAAIVEFAEIYLGLHKHSPEDLKKYKKLK